MTPSGSPANLPATPYGKRPREAALKKDEVPQDKSQALAGQRKLMYAVDDKGDYTGVASAGWEAEDLELEITESMVIENPDASIVMMQRLRAMGVGIAIDDFGTGYSSLSYLTRFPVAKLKLDRSFVRGLPHAERDAAIATSVVAMGHGLKLQVLAEGVETEEQMRFLRDLGCELGQGYLLGLPAPMAA